MKAIEMLEALTRCGVNADDWGMVPMHAKYPFKKFFGGRPIHKFVPGRYVYINVAHISDGAYDYLDGWADHTIFGDDPEEQCTMLFRIEDEI